MSHYELALLMPVYNEEACICQVVDAWHAELTKMGIDFQMIVLNDGSRDQTELKLSAYAGNPRIEVINKPNSGRQLISSISRLAVRLFFGSGVTDVNTPYRLIRSSVLKQIITRIPDDTFAPNILISGELAASGLPILNLPIPHEGRKTGSISIVKWRLWKAAVSSLKQTIAFRLKGVGKVSQL